MSQLKRRGNRNTETSVVNAVRSFFESNGCIYQSVDLANDYGKDAYVDFAEGERITGLCAALQIKGSVSYRKPNGSYFIPLDEQHARIWQESTLPILGLVHDPDDGLVRWCDISGFLSLEDNATATHIPIPGDAILDVNELHSRLRNAVLTNNGILKHPLIQALSRDSGVSESAILDCFALGRSEARIFIGLRYLLRALDRGGVRAFLYVLAHLTPHPDVFWHSENWISQDVKLALQPHLSWQPDEIFRLLEVVEFEEFERGGMGQSLCMLLVQDTDVVDKILEVAVQAGESNREVANVALYLHLYWLGENAPEHFADLLNAYPELAFLPDIPEITQQLQDYGYLAMF